LTSSLLDIHASPFQTPESAPERMIQDISGPTSENISRQCDLFDASLKTSRGISVSDYEKSSKTWKALITQRRLEFSARLKSARRISVSESTSWPTPTTQDNNQVKGKDKRGTTLGGAVRNWPTPTANSRDATPRWTKTRNGKQVVEPNLAGAVQTWPTPRASEYKDCGPVGSKSQIHMDKRGYLCAKAKDENMPTGMLNPDWVEWLMGVPTGWTDLDSWGME